MLFNLLFDLTFNNLTEMTMNTKTKFFETKEQYLNFRKAFASAVNDPRAKKGKPQPPNGYKARGWMTASHFMLLNAVRDLPLTRGFSPITSELKLTNGAIADQAIRDAKTYLEHRIINAKRALDPSKIEVQSWRLGKLSKAEYIERERKDLLRYVTIFLEPFNGTFTVEDLARLDIDTCGIQKAVPGDICAVIKEAPVVVQAQQPVEESKSSLLGNIKKLFGGTK
jgi:hypothetical protein